MSIGHNSIGSVPFPYAVMLIMSDNLVMLETSCPVVRLLSMCLTRCLVVPSIFALWNNELNWIRLEVNSRVTLEGRVRATLSPVVSRPILLSGDGGRTSWHRLC